MRRYRLLSSLLFLLCISASAYDFVLNGTERPVAGNTLSVASAEDLSQYVRKWIKGDEMGHFDAKTVLSATSEYTIAEKDYEHWLRVSVSDNGGETLFSQDLWISKLPVLYIDTEASTPITSKEYYLTASLRIQGNEEFEQQYLGKTQIKGRGNSSWSQYPQKPYKIKLDKKKNLFGFGKSKHWVLISNFNDKCALRNYLASNLAKELGIIGMNMTWVDVVLNGEVKGCYTLSQHVRVDKHSVDIFDWEEEAENIASPLFSAIIMETDELEADELPLLEETMKQNLSWITDGIVTFKGQTYNLADYDLKQDYDIEKGYLLEATLNGGSPTQLTTQKGVHFKVNTPEYLLTNDEMMTYITNLWNDFEAEYLREPTDEGKNFSKYADMESMVGIWLVNEIMGQGDNDNSRFSYVDNNGVLRFGPAWDFDHSSACWTVSDNTKVFSTLTRKKEHIYFDKWFPDPVLCKMAYDAYWETARPFVMEWLAGGGELSSKQTYISEACKTNDNLYGTYPSLLNESAKPRTAEEDYEKLKTFLLEHIDWLDKQFYTLDDLIESMNEVCPYPYDYKPKAKKILQDKHIYIICGERKYSLDGKRIK